MNPLSTSIRIITIVVCAIATNATLGLMTLAYCMVTGRQPDPVLVTAFVSLTSGFAGALTGMLINTRSTPHEPTDPPEVKISNTSDHPVPVKEGA